MDVMDEVVIAWFRVKTKSLVVELWVFFAIRAFRLVPSWRIPIIKDALKMILVLEGAGKFYNRPSNPV